MDRAWISSFTYCDKIQKIPTPGGIVDQIVKPLQELSPISIPSNYSFSIACTISGIKFNPSNQLKITFEDPNGNVLETLEESNCNPPKKSEDPNKSYSMQLGIEIQNTVLNQIGAYGTRVVFNGDELGFYKINVNKVAYPGEHE